MPVTELFDSSVLSPDAINYCQEMQVGDCADFVGVTNGVAQYYQVQLTRCDGLVAASPGCGRMISGHRAGDEVMVEVSLPQQISRTGHTALLSGVLVGVVLLAFVVRRRRLRYAAAAARSKSERADYIVPGDMQYAEPSERAPINAALNGSLAHLPARHSTPAFNPQCAHDADQYHDADDLALLLRSEKRSGTLSSPSATLAI